MTYRLIVENISHEHALTAQKLIESCLGVRAQVMSQSAPVPANSPEMTLPRVEWPDTTTVIIHDLNAVKTLAQLEHESIEKLLRQKHWNISQVARLLGIGRSTLYRKMKEYGIQQPEVASVRLQRSA